MRLSLIRSWLCCSTRRGTVTSTLSGSGLTCGRVADNTEIDDLKSELERLRQEGFDSTSCAPVCLLFCQHRGCSLQATTTTKQPGRCRLVAACA